jgi:hypothetical protein
VSAVAAMRLKACARGATRTIRHAGSKGNLKVAKRAEAKKNSNHDKIIIKKIKK